MISALSSWPPARPAAEASFDFVFIDAEKSGYPQYYEWAMGHVCVSGIIAAHNAFRAGAIVDPNDKTADTEAIRAFNKHVAADPRGISTIYPGRDGTLVVAKVRQAGGPLLFESLFHA